MKLCYALTYYDPAHTVPERFLARAPIMRHLPQAVAALGHEVDCVIVFPTAHQFTEHGVRYHFVRPGPPARRPGPAALQPALRAIRRIRALRPDLIHFHGTNLYLNHAVLLQALGRTPPPVVVHYHGGFPSPNRLARRVQRYTLRRAARVLFTTREHAQPFVDAGLIATPEQVVPFMETSSTFRMKARAEARRETGMMGDPVCLWVGRLDPLKDPMTALQGFAQILAARPGAHLYLHYLADDLLPDLQRYVEATPPLHEHVHFRGPAPFERMETLYTSADFLLQASHREFSGCAVLEAMACGVIPVVTTIPSFRAMTDDGRYGILFAPGDAEALARGVLSVPAEAIPERARQVRAWFEQALSFPALAQHLDAVYREVLES